MLDNPDLEFIDAVTHMCHSDVPQWPSPACCADSCMFAEVSVVLLQLIRW